MIDDRQQVPKYVIEVFNGRRWAKLRGPEGGPWRKEVAERIAARREDLPIRTSSTEGYPHRIREVAS